MVSHLKIKISLITIISFFLLPAISQADILGQSQNFFIDSSYDFRSREEVTAVLKKISQQAYFFVEEKWYQNLTDGEKEKVNQSLDFLAQEFDNVIYPKITALFGEEWRPGIDKDYRITVLFHQMKEGAQGYFNSGNEYLKVQNPKSNEREMVHLNSQTLLLDTAKIFLAHELVHLITFNQKERLRGVEEEVWLNEARAELAPTFLGYDQEAKFNNLSQRIKIFVENPNDSLTEWQGKSQDYGVVNVFFQYLLERYGKWILTNSLKSSKVGIPSLNEALKNQGFKEDLAQVFQDWVIAIYLNNCDFGKNYCYQNESLKNLRILPSLIYLPPTEKTEFSLNYSISQWSGNWYKIIGGGGEKLKINFQGDKRVNFKIIYILCQDNKSCQINNFLLSDEQKGEMLFDGFGKKFTSLTLIPLIQDKISGFGEKEPTFSFSLSAFIAQANFEKAIEELKIKIEELKKQIAFYQEKINQILNQKQKISCQKIESDLFFGMTNNSQVRCLQEFLKIKEPELYPQGLVTGNFFNLTLQAVIRFQEKYASEILTPSGLQKGTGYVGSATRNKINQLLF